jgi:hypothetical protein
MPVCAALHHFFALTYVPRGAETQFALFVNLFCPFIERIFTKDAASQDQG